MSARTPSRTLNVKSFGCQTNVDDGERMDDLLVAEGMKAALGSSPFTYGNWLA